MSARRFSVLRGVSSRATSTTMIFLVAVVAVAAAATAPAYYASAQTSIARDNLAGVPVLGRGFSVVDTGPVSGTLENLSAEMSAVLAQSFGRDPSDAARLFQAPVDAIEARVDDPAEQQRIPLAWRSDACAHLSYTGRCPTASGDVLVSASLATAFGWHIGERLAFPPWQTLTVTGIYAPPSGGDYWFDRLSTYFPTEFPLIAVKGVLLPTADALFTARATLEDAPAGTQGVDVVDDLLAVSQVQAGDVRALQAAIMSLVGNEDLQLVQAVTTSDIPTTMASITSAWSSLEIPVVVVSAQLIALAWLMMFVLVAEHARSRGGEVALGKLRGQGGIRVATFGLSEPAVLLAVSLPLGVLGGWGLARLLAHPLLRPGTLVPLPALSWATGAAACAGGLVAVVFASWRTIRRPVVEEWRRAGRHAGQRGWVLDAVLLTAAAAGVADLLATGTVSSTHKSPLALLVPGLLGVAVAVVASRLLLVACQALTSGAGRIGGLGTYLALRHVARRPGGARTTIMLATAFSLVTFAVAAWAVNQHNDVTWARAEVGAPAVFDVAVPPAANLATLVRQADSSGRKAAAVIEYASNGTTTMAVDTTRWVNVATWPGAAPSHLAALLHPPAPAPVLLTGTALRVALSVTSLSPPGSVLTLDVDSPTGTAPTPVDLGVLPSTGGFAATASLPGCPCVLQDVSVQPNPSLYASGHGPPLRGTITVTAIDLQNPHGRWVAAGGGLTQPGRWHTDNPTEAAQATPDGLRWTFDLNGESDAVLAPIDRPAQLPAIEASAATGGKTGPQTVTGLDGNDLAVDVDDTAAAIPGAPTTGVIVDLDYATLAAGGFISVYAIPQVWIAAGAQATVAHRLQQLGVKILSTTSESATAALVGRQGPGLARALFLAEAAAAATLATAAAILGLYLFARRRRYEYAALAISGLRTKTLLVSLVVEQVVIVGFSLAVGIAAGLAAEALALRSVAEFLTTPPFPLDYLPPRGELVVLLTALAAGVLTATLAASLLLTRSIHLDQLREAPA